MSLLVLGGTREGHWLAEQLCNSQIDFVYSMAGRLPAVTKAYPVITGGFSQYGGLKIYIKRQAIKAIADLTHPYASQISQLAFEAAANQQITYWRYQRPAWAAEPGDNWQEFADIASIVEAAKFYTRIAVTLGQLQEDQIKALARNNKQLWVRTAVMPAYAIPARVNWIKSIGPFAYEDEYDWLKRHDIQLLLSKNSGGKATKGKIQAARELQIPVLMLKRPVIIDSDNLYPSKKALLQEIRALYKITER